VRFGSGWRLRWSSSVEVVRGMGVERAGEQFVLGDDVHRSAQI